MSSEERIQELLGQVLPAERIGRFSGGDGVPACPLAAPARVDEAQEILALARAERWTLLPLGNGTKLGWERAPERVDLVLASTNLTGIAAYEPDDGTLTALAGTLWSDLVQATRPRHHLSPELPAARTATLGGVLGAGASGFDRLRHGPVRHQVLGMRALQADGSLIMSGGRVVKNVTGYDLHRLWCGSRGSLCFLLEATLRLYPAAAAHAWLRVPCRDLADGLARCHALHRTSLQPLAVLLNDDGEGPEVIVVLAGRPEAVASEVETTRRLLGEPRILDGAEALSAREETRERELRSGRWPPLLITCRPSRLADLLASLENGARDLALRLRIHPLLATLTVAFEDGECSPERVARLERVLADSGADRHWRGLGADQPPRPVASEAARLMHRIRHSMDPERLFARAHFDGNG